MFDYVIIMIAYNHTVHQNGQATPYLPLSGITPPRYRYWDQKYDLNHCLWIRLSVNSNPIIFHFQDVLF